MPSDDRFRPHASDAMASMFDDVSGRYDLLNRVMTLGQDGVWRQAMWRAVPADAHVVLDLCTGSGVSLPGLRRPGRTLLGMDVSLAMLEVAQEQYGGGGWAPRLACADAFHLPLRAGSVDAITVAFGVRNLRPRPAALAEMARVLRPGGVLAVLEAAAPAPGPLHGPHALWVRHVIPFAGRLSADPTAYRYLSQSIFEFGAGPGFERDLDAAGFTVEARRAFLLGATRLWVARRGGPAGQDHAAATGGVQDARRPEYARDVDAEADPQARLWLGTQLAVALALSVTLAWALVRWINLKSELPLTDLQRGIGWVLLVGGLVVFGIRTAWLALRWVGGARGR